MISPVTILTAPPHGLSFSLVEKALLAGFAVSASLLAGAHIFQALGYEPCDLCLDQREAHWTALAITALGLMVSRAFKAPLLAAAAVGTAALVYGFGAMLAFYHTGIEFHFWPGPASCSTNKTVTDIADLSVGLDGSRPRVSCDQTGWAFFGVTMAGYNMLFSAGLFALTTLATAGALRTARLKGRMVQ
ncbi:MAG: disulfide bond formation protein B [Pseudomonadota bacterium]